MNNISLIDKLTEDAKALYDLDHTDYANDIMEAVEEIEKLRSNKQTREIDHYESSKLIIALQDIIEMNTKYSNATVKRMVTKARRARNHWLGLN